MKTVPAADEAAKQSGTSAQRPSVATPANVQPAPAIEEQPVHGGSYVRDPATGQLRRVGGVDITEIETRQTEA